MWDWLGSTDLRSLGRRVRKLSPLSVLLGATTLCHTWRTSLPLPSSRAPSGRPSKKAHPHPGPAIRRLSPPLERSCPNNLRQDDEAGLGFGRAEIPADALSERGFWPRGGAGPDGRAGWLGSALELTASRSEKVSRRVSWGVGEQEKQRAAWKGGKWETRQRISGDLVQDREDCGRERLGFLRGVRRQEIRGIFFQSRA